MKLTKEKLLASDGVLALTLAKMSDKDFARSKYAQDYDIVSQQGGEIAYYLAEFSYKTGWDTDSDKILNLEVKIRYRTFKIRELFRLKCGEYTKEELLDNNGQLALDLAYDADQAFADSEFAQDIDIVGQREGRVAHYLASKGGKTGWKTDKLRIMVMSELRVVSWLDANAEKTGWKPCSSAKRLLEIRAEIYFLTHDVRYA